MEITVRITGQYGLRVVYPVCEKALLLARLAGFKTLPSHALETIKALGYSINVIPDTKAIRELGYSIVQTEKL